jgi:recombination protein RecT
MAQPPSKSLAPVDEFRGLLQKMEPQFRMVLPPHVPPERFVRVVVTAVQKEPKLLQCNRQTLFAAAMRAATDGLLPDGREGAIVPYGDEAQWMPMIAGLLKKARNSGEIASVAAEIVHTNDSEGQHLDHEPLLFGERGEVLGVYALAKTKDDAVYIETLTVAQVEKIRAVSKARNSPAWTNWWDEMAKVKALRRLSKRLPSSTDKDEAFHRAVERTDDEVEALPEATVEAASSQPPKKKSRLERVIETETNSPTPEIDENERLPFEKNPAPASAKPEVPQ